MRSPRSLQPCSFLCLVSASLALAACGMPEPTFEGRPDAASPADAAETPDAGPEANHETGLDAPPDVSSPDVVAEDAAPPEAAAEAAADAAEAGPDVQPDVPIDVDCGPATKLCSGSCVGLDDPAFGCAAATCSACPFANAAASCQAGACAMGTCNAGFADCDGQPATGCEIDTTTSAQNCGGCGNKCPTPSNSAPACSSSSCSFQCTGQFADCNKLTSDGCEVDTASDKNHCGACAFACSLPHASEKCAQGQCGIAQCEAGFQDCDGNVANGCEVSLTSDPLNCGACGTTCAPVPNAKPACVNQACGFVCNSGWADCDGIPSNGCEGQPVDYPAVVLSDAPAGYWRLGESTGATAVDSSGNGLHGAYSGALSPQPGAIACDPNKAASFTPTLNQYIAIPRSALLEPATALTIELWFKQTGVPGAYQKMVWYGDAAKAPGGSWGILRQNKIPGTFTLFLAATPNNYWLDVPNLPVDVWTHLVFTYDGSTERGFVNGVQASSFPASGALKYDLVTGMKIGGAGPYYDLYQGGLDEVAIYNKVLSPARILAHYQAGSP